MVDANEYRLRIANANPAQLVVINFEMVIVFLDDGQIEKAKDALEQLVRSLNFEISLAHDFYEIYKYINELLITAQFSKDEVIVTQSVSEVRELMGTLLDGWRNVEKQVADLPPVAGESPKIYAGLTYSRDGQVDEYVDEGNNKGYMA
ncbi:MAG: flagellar protein FliS [Defluviitaleaceae bacterium]|nr:flagellar protein FliS [Defluviitaleaceae bacterium]